MSRNLIRFSSDFSDEDGILIEQHHSPAGETIPLHWHEYLEFELIISGTGRHVYNRLEYPLSRGSVYMTGYHDLHELTSLTGLEIYSIHFSRQFLDPEIARYLDYNRFHFQLSEEETARVIRQIEKLMDEINSDYPLRSLRIKNLFSEIMVMMIRKSSPKELHALPETIQQVLAYMNENFRHKLTLRQVAEQVSFSPNYLGLLFKQQIGCTFNEYLHTLRLKYACSLLLKSDLSIKEIAAASGYSSTEHFLSSFKQKMQRTPGEYRRTRTEFS